MNFAGRLRAGYPEGVPDVDYIPLFALLGSRLTNDEVAPHSRRDQFWPTRSWPKLRCGVSSSSVNPARS
jgi:Protein of unknown function (DUF3349)